MSQSHVYPYKATSTRLSGPIKAKLGRCLVTSRFPSHPSNSRASRLGGCFSLLSFTNLDVAADERLHFFWCKAR
ncbi:predicted protein [Plenodomus lingam JN3]|uniref:Predicted protein n=1 Tax=Leptosphaeria maculans (strain JN3 / isolate v23.1.3 / race Av1-4-5-6-7-8) TaxID=985895 RepID=E5AE86_LEPMJ|nr:predicted protein [Plenodomus lingam JN3]CBY01525.1 predicted protein [Plenodomus lingam JN3]